MKFSTRLLSAVALLAGVATAQSPPTPNAAPASAAAANAGSAPPVLVLPINGAIGPATAEYVHLGLQRAAEQGAQLLVLQLDTPGGLDTSMRDIIKSVLASTVPVACFVAPQGARAASAGTYILYASHIAAMAPATNLGAATPIAIGMPNPGGNPGGSPGGNPEPQAPAAAKKDGASGHDTLTEKRINDATAYIRGLAQLRERNVVWAEQAVRDAVSLPARDALASKVIDLIAADVPDLLRQLDGRTIRMPNVGGGSVTLNTAHAPVVVLEADWRGRLLAVISDPSVALVLMMIGVYGLLFEFMNPGFVAPGVIGGLSLLLGLWALQMLPINYAGLALIVLGIGFFVAEAFVPSYGTLGIGGVAAFAFGALLLIDTDVPGFGVPWSLVATLSLASAACVIGIVGMAVRARRRPVVSGTATMLGATAELIAVDGREGWATVNGERWQIVATHEVQVGQRARVTRVNGLTLEVSPIPDSTAGAAPGIANQPQGVSP